jgi:hypothetical protein
MTSSHWGDITAQSTEEMPCKIYNGPCPNDRPATFVKQGKWVTVEDVVVPPAPVYPRAAADKMETKTVPAATPTTANPQTSSQK